MQNEFDWSAGRKTPLDYHSPPVTIMDALERTIENNTERKLRMLRQLKLTCMSCSMCELGRSEACKDDICRDPHVLSNMNVAKVVVVGQNPGWTELKECTPFVGAAGKNFDDELAKHGLDRSLFYITNIVKCFTPDNAKPSNTNVVRCRPFLTMEVTLLRPKFIVTLGAVAFGTLCPDASYQMSLGTFTDCKEFDTKVFAVYHPSPLNLSDSGRRADFGRQMAILCSLVKRLNSQN